MAAVSTARRNRWRTAFIRHGANFYERVLSDAVAIEQDVVWAAHVIINEGEKIESILDSFNTESGALGGSFDELAVVDSFDLHYSRHRLLTESIETTDNVEQLLERNRSLISVTEDGIGVPAINDNYFADKIPYQDQLQIFWVTLGGFNNRIEVTDSVIATPVLAPFVNFSVLIDSISLADSISVSGSKLNSQVLADSILQFNIYDAMAVTITRTVIPPVVYSRTVSDSVVVSDSVTATFIGIVPRVLSDSITANDFRKIISAKKLVSVVDVNDQLGDKLTDKIIVEPIIVTDDMIVGRAAIIDTVADLSVITAFFDQAIATKTEFVQASAEIVIGIEVQ